MAYSEKKAKEIKSLALELGITKAAKKLGMIAESVKRAIRIADKSKQKEVIHIKQNHGDINIS